jgi:hypothetical protein
MVAQVRPPSWLPARSASFSYDVLWPDYPLDGVGVDLDAAIAQEALEGCAPGRGIADRLGEFGFAGQVGQLLLPQIEQRCDNGGGLLLSRFHPRCRILAVDVWLDKAQPSSRRSALPGASSH